MATHLIRRAATKPYKPYNLYVDKQGQLGCREVREAGAGDNTGLIGDDSYQSNKKLIVSNHKLLRANSMADLKKDMAFKMFLGNMEYKDEVAIPFHRAFWGDKVEITDLELITAPLIGSTVNARNLNPDVVWQDPGTGNVFMAEMQRRYQEFFCDRIALYDGKLRAELAKKGSKWDYDQVGVYIIGLADFKLQKQGPTDYLHSYLSVNASDSSDMLTGKDWKMLVDLRKFSKVKPEIYDERWKWLQILKRFHNLKSIPSYFKGGYFDTVIKIAKKINNTPMDEFMDYVDFRRRTDREKMLIRHSKAEETLRMIKKYILANPNCSIAETAALFDVDQQIVQAAKHA